MRRRTKIILIQVVILAGVVAYFKVALPRIEKGRAAAQAEKREQAIESFFHSITIEAEKGESNPTAASERTTAVPRRLRRLPEVVEVQRALGAPNQNMTDFAGAQHLTWFGTKRKLIASFNKGRLYAVTVSDFAEERGEKVFESSAQWQKF